MSRTGTRDEHRYYDCPECGRTVFVMYDEPEPAITITCDDGHSAAKMAAVYPSN